MLKAWVCARSPVEIVGSNTAGSMDVGCECCVLSGRGLCFGLITLPEEFYRLECDLKKEEVMTGVGPQRHMRKYSCLCIFLSIVCSRNVFVGLASY